MYIFYILFFKEDYLLTKCFDNLMISFIFKTLVRIFNAARLTY